MDKIWDGNPSCDGNKKKAHTER